MDFQSTSDSLEGARALDNSDSLSRFRQEFEFPTTVENPLYFAGHSLGLMPKKSKTYVNEDLEAWAKYGVEGHFEGKHPWLPYHENVTGSLARLVGAKTQEVVAMNSLTVNLHLALVSFYRPTKQKFKILIENNTFPSDKYAVESQARFHGFDPKEAIIELKPKAGSMTLSLDEIKEQIEGLKGELALVLLGNCQYLSGQLFPFKEVVEAAHGVGAVAGFNLAHGAGNLHMKLHDWQVDFAVWCSYKYLNSGPGGIAGLFIHESHLGKKDIPRFEGWWGHDKKTRFKMPPHFSAIDSVEAWQLSNPPILQLAALRASLEIFDKATVGALSEKSKSLTGYFESLLKKHLPGEVDVQTPPTHRGAMLCLKFKTSPRTLVESFKSKGVFVDFREPDIIRATPAPLYNSFEDVFRFVQILKDLK